MEDEQTRGLALDLAYLRGRTREAPGSPPEISDRTWAIGRARAHRALIGPVVLTRPCFSGHRPGDEDLDDRRGWLAS